MSRVSQVPKSPHILNWCTTLRRHSLPNRHRACEERRLPVARKIRWGTVSQHRNLLVYQSISFTPVARHRQPAALSGAGGNAVAAQRDLFARLEAEMTDKSAARARRTSLVAGDEYNEADIEVLEGLEPVRRRPGMYIGGTDEKALHHLFAEVIDNSMDEAVAGHATWIEVRLDADGFLTVTDNGRGIPVDPHPKFKNKSALEVDHDHAARRRQIRRQGLSDIGRPARRRRLGRQRAVGTAGSRGRARPAALSHGVLARRSADQAGKARLDHEPARHQGALPARRADLRQGRQLQAGAALEHGALEGLSVRRRRDPLVVRSGAHQGRHAGRSGVPFPRRAQGLSGGQHRRGDAWSPRTSSPAASRRKAGTARSNGRSPGSRTTTASAAPTATPFRPPRAARTRMACAQRCPRRCAPTAS